MAPLAGRDADGRWTAGKQLNVAIVSESLGLLTKSMTEMAAAARVVVNKWEGGYCPGDGDSKSGIRRTGETLRPPQAIYVSRT